MKHEKHVLITGANGFIGKHVSALFESHGWKVTKAVRKPVHPDEVFFDLEETNKAALSALPKVDAIIHLAAKVDFGKGDIDSLITANVVVSEALAKLARENGAFFLFSSASLLDLYNYVDDEFLNSPGFSYMRSKLLAERNIEAEYKDATILRICGVYGAHGPEHLGINKTIHVLAHGGTPQQVATGRAKRNYLYVKDLAQMIYSATMNRLTGIHSVASTEVLSISEMLSILCLRFSPDRKVEIIKGQEAQDQIINPSPLLPSHYTFKEAVDDIYADLFA